MKKQHLLSNLFVLLAFSASVASAQEKEKKRYEFFKERDFSHSYPLSVNEQLKLSNQFGQIEIKTWSKNEVKVDVHIATSSTVKEANDERFENINIKHSKEGGTVSFVTEMNIGKKPEYNGNQSNSIDIDYVVYMPATAALNVKNKFGKTIIPTLTNKVDVEQEFGELVAGHLSQNSSVDLKFSKASFESLNDTKVNVQFAKDPIVIKNANGKLDLNVKHCKQGITIYTDQLTNLDIDAEFSNIGVVFNKEASASFKIKTDFGSFTNQSTFTLKDEDEDNTERQYGPRFAYSYKGTTGDGKMKVDIDGKHSDIIVSNGAPDFSKIKKKKNRVVI